MSAETSFVNQPHQHIIQQIAAIETNVMRVRIVGILLILSNLLVITIAFAGFLRVTDTSFNRPDTLLLLGGLGAYMALSVILLVLMYQSTRHSRAHQQSLRGVLQHYQRRTDELQIAARIARDASIGTKPADILQRTVDLISERFDFYHTGIFLIAPNENGDPCATLRAAAGNGNSAKMVNELHRLLVGGQSIIGHVTASGQSRVVLDVNQDVNHLPNPHLPFTRSEMAVPLKIDTRIIGALDVQSQRVGAFSHDDVAILEILADLIAVTIDKATLHETVQTHAIVLEQTVEARTRELRTERAQMRAILEAMTEGVIYYEGDELVYVNEALTTLIGYTEADWQGLTPLLHIAGTSASDAQHKRQTIHDTIADAGIWSGDLKLRRKDDTEFDAHITGVRVDRDDDTPEGILTILRDISQEKALQERQTRFVSYASHELRTPLSNMKTQLYLLKQKPQRLQHHIAIMTDVVARMQRLVDDLLTKSRFERGLIHLDRRRQSLTHVLRTVYDLQQPEAEQHDLTLSYDAPTKPFIADIDADRITQVITNLISNAINYTPAGGHIHLAIQAYDAAHVDIVVRDTGVGIPEDVIDEVFMPFFRADNAIAKGTGLGLNISKQIIDMHEGQIFVESEENVGSTFTIRLRVADETAVNRSP